MNCDEIRRHWHLYHDSEGDAELHWSINQHLEGCAACAEWFAKQSRFEELVAEKLRKTPSDERLWEGILVGAGLARPESSRRWFLFSSLAACAATVLILLAGSWLFRSDKQHAGSSLSKLTVDWHERLTTGVVRAPFQSQSDLEVEDYLVQKVAFPVRCPPRKDSGFAVRGAGTCRLADQAAAYVVGDVDDTPVSMFILSSDSVAAFPRQQEALKRERIHHCREGGRQMAMTVIDRNLVLVIGDVSHNGLTRMLRAYGTYPHRS